MTDRCETCGWFIEPTGGEPYGFCSEAPPGGIESKDRRMYPSGRCSRHTAVQRRRDRMMLAGQALAGLVGDPNCDSMSAEWHAETSYRFADAVLDRDA